MAQSFESRWQRAVSTHYWGFWYALCFLTRLPCPYLKRLDKDVEQVALWYYPIVGAILAGLLLLLALSVWQYNADASLLLMAALMLALWVYSTGAMHLDGVADMGDAWVGGLGSLERTLEIMKDPRIGSMGAASMLIIMLLKFAGLHALLEQSIGNYWLLVGLLLILVMARVGIIALMASMVYVRKEGMSSNLQGGRFAAKLVVMAPAIVLLAVWLLADKAGLLLMAWLVMLMLYRAVLKRRLGGYTGDTLGAAVEIQEALLLAVLVL